ncbi:glycosyltransferase, partial [Neobacillus drentensis]|uniref:glycosyltransferase n=1 Tax=Neobacillus drentensis TaxID=220684 RepID=UPI00300150F0
MDKKYKICFFSGDISRNGGTERVATIIANGLVERGHEVLFLSYKGGLKSYYHLDKKVKLYSINMENYKDFFSRKIMPYKNLIRFFKAHKVDIVIDIDILLSIYTLPIKKIVGAKVISWEHFNLLENRVKTRVLARRLATIFADSIITLNRNDMENYLSITPAFNKKKIRFIYNPAIAKYETKTNLVNKTVIAVGRLTYQKNFQLLIKLWKEIEKKNPEWKLVIVGEGEDRESLDELILINELKNVSITGFKEDI